jgi:hypothetical protein
MKTEKLFVLCSGADYEGEMLVGIFSSSDACVDHAKAERYKPDFYSIYECEVDKPFPASYPDPIFTLRGGKRKKGRG